MIDSASINLKHFFRSLVFACVKQAFKLAHFKSCLRQISHNYILQSINSSSIIFSLFLIFFRSGEEKNGNFVLAQGKTWRKIAQENASFYRFLWEEVQGLEWWGHPLSLRGDFYGHLLPPWKKKKRWPLVTSGLNNRFFHVQFFRAFCVAVLGSSSAGQFGQGCQITKALKSQIYQCLQWGQKFNFLYFFNFEKFAKCIFMWLCLHSVCHSVRF